jgi:hypothetical protein
MKESVPQSVLALPPGRLVVVPTEEGATLYLREDNFGMRKYPQRCPFEMRLASWDMDGALAIVLMARLAASDATTFECWIDAAHPAGVRTLQCLASQPYADLHIVTTGITRSLRANNDAQMYPSILLNMIRSRPAWTPEGFAGVIRRLTTLYPTAKSLWWAAEQSNEN